MTKLLFPFYRVTANTLSLCVSIHVIILCSEMLKKHTKTLCMQRAMAGWRQKMWFYLAISWQTPLPGAAMNVALNWNVYSYIQEWMLEIWSRVTASRGKQWLYLWLKFDKTRKLHEQIRVCLGSSENIRALSKQRCLVSLTDKEPLSIHLNWGLIQHQGVFNLPYWRQFLIVVTTWNYKWFPPQPCLWELWQGIDTLRQQIAIG
jgi:hypothetical protein